MMFYLFVWHNDNTSLDVKHLKEVMLSKILFLFEIKTLIISPVCVCNDLKLSLFSQYVQQMDEMELTNIEPTYFTIMQSLKQAAYHSDNSSICYHSSFIFSAPQIHYILFAWVNVWQKKYSLRKWSSLHKKNKYICIYSFEVLCFI